MNNIDFNNAAVNMGYRYMGVLSNGNYVWGKPVGNIILRLEIEPNMTNIIVSDIIQIKDIENSTENDIKTTAAVYASFKLKNDETDDVDIASYTYDDFVDFIATAESEINISNAMMYNYGYNSNFAFKRNDMTANEMLMINY